MQVQKVFAAAAQEEQMWLLVWGFGSYHRVGSFRQPWLSFYPGLIGSVFWNKISQWLYDSTAITSPFTVGAPLLAKISLCFIIAAAAFGLNPQGLSVEAVTPDIMLVVETWGLGFSLQQKQLCLRWFLCRKFHYIRVQQGGGGVKRQLGYGTGTQ